MKNSNKLMQVLLLSLGYIDLFCIAVVGGFVLYKDSDEGNKNVAKLSILVSLIFFAISTILLFLLNAFDVFNGNFASYTTFVNVVFLVKTIVFIVLIVLALCDKLNNSAK